MEVLLIISLAVAGIVLVGLELLVIPGFGVSGMLGIAALIGAIFVASNSFVEAVIFSAITLVVISAAIYLLWKKGFLNNNLFLKTRQSSGEGYVASKPGFEGHLGRIGTAMTPLRPAGTADFDGERLDVVTEGGFIDRGAKVIVIDIQGGRIIVRVE